jgi:regulator of nucleoside diphosphate kinase
MKNIAHNNPKPPLVIDAADFDRLASLADAALARNVEVAENLLAELDRASVVPAAELPPDTIGMRSDVEFRDNDSGRVQRVQLVFPNEADIAAGRISVLTPIGTALIGLRTGQTIAWTTRGGDVRSLTVLEVGGRQAAAA